MKRFMNKKVAAIAAAVGLTLGLGGAAFAYFTSNGAGNGSATVGTSGNNVAVEGSSTPALVPGETATMSFAGYNYSAQSQAIQTITLTGVEGCSVPFSTISTASYTAATTPPTCSDTATNLVANDTNCAGGGAGTSNSNWFSMPVVDLNDSNAANGDLAPSASNTALTPTGTITMNDLAVNQDACEGLYLNFEFTTA
jgi:hypothetical protein